MNNKYKSIYLTDKSEQYVQKVPMEELNEATMGLEVIEDNKEITVWECDSYQIFAIKL